MKHPLTITRDELEMSFDTYIKPLYDTNVGFGVRGISFDNQHWINRRYAITYNEVKIFVYMQGTIQYETRNAFRSYFKHLLDGKEHMLCTLNCYTQKIRLYLEYENDPADGFQSNAYVNQNVILALQILREKAAQLNPQK